MTYDRSEVDRALASRLDTARRQLDYAREAPNPIRRAALIQDAQLTIRDVQAALRGEAPDRNVVPLRKMSIAVRPSDAAIERAYVSPQADGGAYLSPEPAPYPPRDGEP